MPRIKKHNKEQMKAQLREMLSLVSADSPLPAKEIADRLNVIDTYDLSQPLLRAIMTEMLRDGFPLGASSAGFYTLTTQEEAEDYVARLNKHIAGTRKRIEYVGRLVWE